MSPEHVAERRAAVVDFISAAIFVSPGAGNAKLGDTNGKKGGRQ
jgi:hypothetical protein